MSVSPVIQTVFIFLLADQLSPSAACTAGYQECKHDKNYPSLTICGSFDEDPDWRWVKAWVKEDAEEGEIEEEEGGDTETRTGETNQTQ